MKRPSKHNRNITNSKHIKPVSKLVPFPSLSAMRTSLGQRVWEYHRLVSCQFHSWCSREQLLRICFYCWRTEKKIKEYMTEILLFAWWNLHEIFILCFKSVVIVLCQCFRSSNSYMPRLSRENEHKLTATACILWVPAWKFWIFKPLLLNECMKSK